MKKLLTLATGVKVDSEGKMALWVIIGLGIIFRLFHFFDNRSLYVDEIFLATSLVKMNFLELAAPMLDYEQKAPLGFLWMERLMVMLFGTREMALRLFPLLCGIASLFLFLPVARYFLKPIGVVVAVGILAAAPPLIYHAVEAKQYSTELFSTVIALFLYTHFHQKISFQSLIFWGISGAILLWFSFSSIFILAGIAIGSSIYYLVKKEWQHLFRFILPFSLWFTSFVVTYIMFTHQHGDSEWLQDWFKIRGSFMPFPPSSVADLGWFFKKIFSLLHHPLGLSWFELTASHKSIVRVLSRMSLLPFVLLIVGTAGFYSKNKKEFIILLLPILLTLTASGLELYPFMDRLIVFLAPVLILLVARGCVIATDVFSKDSNARYILPALLLAGPFANASYQVINPAVFGDYKKSYQVETLSYINDRYQQGDVVYIYWNDLVGYRYYKTTLGFKFEAVEGKDYRYMAKNKEDYYRRLRADVDKLRGNKRLWLIYSNRVWSNIGDFDNQPLWYYAADNSRRLLYKNFASLGEEIDRYQTTEVNVHLFDMNKR